MLVLGLGLVAQVLGLGLGLGSAPYRSGAMCVVWLYFVIIVIFWVFTV